MDDTQAGRSRDFELSDRKQLAHWHARIPKFARDRTEQVPYPFAIFNIEITNRCPLKCVMCPRTEDMTREEGHMDFELFRKIAGELAEHNPEWPALVPVRLHGFGESAVHPNFDGFIRYAEGLGINTCLSVNPIVLTADIGERLLRAGPSLLYISLDGHDDETFLQIRGLPRAYERSKANLLRLLELKRQRGITTKIVLSMIDFHLNERSIGAAQEYWSGIEGIDEVRIKPFCNWDGNSDSVNRLVGIGTTAETGDRQSEPVVCRWPWTSVTVLWDGSVVPCCYDFDKRYSLGNAGTESLVEIWRGPRMRALRREFISGDVTNSLCKNCSSLRA